MIGLALPQYRSAIATDLKVTVGTEMSLTELNRAVERAVNDLSRYFPLEQVHEETLDFDIEDESITTPATADPDAIVDAVTLNGKSDGSTLTITDNTPDVPRRLTVTLTDANASVTALTIIVKGYDKDGYYVEEQWFLKDLPSGTAVQGKLYFKYVSEVEVDDVAGTQDVADVIDVGTGNAYDSYISLTNKPIKPGSETVTNAAGTTTYDRDDDYTMDYTNGGIKFINGGDMAAGTAYLIDYTKSKLGVNISSILPVITKITKVQYPADLIPQQFVSFNIVGDFMYVASKQAGQSQEQLSDGEHLVIWYERMHTPPGEVGPGSYPSVLDEVVIIGAAGYALLTEAQQYEQQAATDLASARTELGYIGGADGVSAVHALADAALDKAAVLLTATTGKIDIALTKVALYLETNDAGAGGVDNAKDVLANITDNVAELRDKVNDAVDAMATALGKTSSVDIDAATVGAIAWLLEGELTINTINVGENVPAHFANYAATKVQIAQARIAAAQAYAQEAQLRLSNLNSYITEASGWMRMGETFIAEASQLINQVNAAISEAATRIATIDRYLAEAARYEAIATQDLLLADRFRAEGLERRNQFWSILKNKAEARRRTSSVPTKQPG